MPQKTTKPIRRRRSTKASTDKAEQRIDRERVAEPHEGATAEHDAIATRAYFISLEEDRSDELANWLRAERELTAV